MYEKWLYILDAEIPKLGFKFDFIDIILDSSLKKI